MAHEISLREDGTGEAMFGSNTPAWHGLGVVVPGTRTWLETIELAGLNWLAEKRQLGYMGKPIPAWGIFRNDRLCAAGYLGTVGRRYSQIQNQFAFSFVDAILEAMDGAHYESAGALGRGERIWCLAKIPHDFVVAGVDRHLTYLLFTNSHDASVTCQCRLTYIRVVCANTLQMALAGVESKIMKIRHSGEAEKKLDAAREMMKGAIQSVAAVKEKLDVLATRQLNTAKVLEAYDRIFPKPEDAPSSARRETLLLKLTDIFQKNDDNAFPQFAGTAYALLQSITRFVDHQRPVRFTTTRPRDEFTETQVRSESALFGSGEALKEKALEELLEMAA